MRLTRFLPRFSLRTLLLLSLLAASGAALWRNSEPWHIFALLPLGEESLSAAAFSPDGKKIATLGDTTLSIWNAETGRLTDSMRVLEEPGYYYAVEFSPDGKRIFSTFTDKNSAKSFIEICDSDKGGGKIRVEASSLTVSQSGFSSNGNQILDRYCIGLWDIASRQQILKVGFNSANLWGVFNPPPPDLMNKIDCATTIQVFADLVKNFPVRGIVSGDRRIAATNIYRVSKTQIWNLVDGKKICEIPNDESEYLSNDGLLIASWINGETTVWDARQGKVTIRFQGPAPSKYRATKCFSPDNRFFACVIDKLEVWDVRTGALKFRADVNTPDDCGLVYSQDGTRLFLSAFGGETRIAQIRDANTGARLGTISAKDELSGTSNWYLSNDSSALICGYDEENAALWHRRRPEWWWGIAWLPEFWLMAVFAVAFLWSVLRDRRELRKKANAVQSVNSADGAASSIKP